MKIELDDDFIKVMNKRFVKDGCEPINNPEEMADYIIRLIMEDVGNL